MTTTKTKTKCQRDAEKLVANLYRFINYLDTEMKNPSITGKGKRMAHIISSLEMNVDSFARYTLDYGWKKISNLKGKTNVKE